MTIPVQWAGTVREQVLASKTLAKIFAGLALLQTPAFVSALISDENQRLEYAIWLGIMLLHHMISYLLARTTTLKLAAFFFVAYYILVSPFFMSLGIVNDPISLVYFLIPSVVIGFAFGSRKMMYFVAFLGPYLVWMAHEYVDIEGILGAFISIFICTWLVKTFFAYSEKVGNIRREALRRANKRLTRANRAKSSMLDNMSHELLTPLTSILGFSELLKTENADPELDESVNSIVKSSHRLRTVLQSLLEVAQIEGGDLNVENGVVDVRGVVASVSEIIRPRLAKKGVEFHLVVPDEKLLVVGASSAIGRIIFNILDNAVIYTKEGQVRIIIDRLDDFVRIKVSDTGPGMKKSFSDFAFDAFRQESEGVGRQHEGAGLGLTIARQLTKMMKGNIRINATLGRGTDVIIELPAFEVAQEEEDSIFSFEPVAAKLDSVKDWLVD